MIRNSQCVIQYVIVCLQFTSTSLSRMDNKMCTMLLHWFEKCKKKNKDAYYYFIWSLALSYLKKNHILSLYLTL